MIVTTTLDIEGHKIIKYLGIARGINVRSPTISQGVFGGLQKIVGGNIEAYTQMCEQAREQSYDLMVKQATKMGADALVGVRYDASDVAERCTEVLCYGTAVKIESIS